MVNQDTHQSKGIAFIDFENEKCAQAAIANVILTSLSVLDESDDYLKLSGEDLGPSLSAENQEGV